MPEDRKSRDVLVGLDAKELIRVEGTVEDIVYKNEETGFVVAMISVGDELVTLVGEGIEIDEGEQVCATGRYTTHATYGYQFKASVIERKLPSTANAILKYLSSGAIKGIGPQLAKRLVEAFGDDTLEIMENHPEQMTVVRGISASKAKEIAQKLAQLNSLRITMLKLSQYGLDTRAAIAIWKKWGEEAVKQVEQNPYLLCIGEFALAFEKADAIAATLDMPADNPDRVICGVLYVLLHNTTNGHVCLPLDKLISTACAMLEVGHAEVEESVQALIEREMLICYEKGAKQYIYLPEYYTAEWYAAQRISMMLRFPVVENKALIKQISALEKQQGITYAQLQKQAIVAAVTQPIFILTGGPGTGKTTTLNAIIQLCEQQGETVLLAAPTGRAAQRMSQVTGHEAKTIHRLLEYEYRPSDNTARFRRNEKNPLRCHVLIVDEMSMVDSLLFESLLRAVKMGCKLVLVGDSDQLPSVGGGNVLGDLIKSERVATIHLSEVFRQAAKSLIVTNAHRIVTGQLPEITTKDNDFFFLRAQNEVQSANTVVSLCSTRLPKSYGYSPFEDIQVITPTRVGSLGATQLNEKLQQVLNPKAEGKREFKHGPYLFREGDKVMQTKNNYDIFWKKDGEEGMGVFNGDIGVITMVDLPSKSLEIDFEGKKTYYTFDMADDLELAYAITVHKSQGSEFEAVIIPLMDYKSKMYFRNLLYTAVTRAKRMLILLGSQESLAYMVGNHRTTLRYTNLATLLTEQTNMPDLNMDQEGE